MRVLNRTAVSVTGGQPYLEWAHQQDADFNKGAVSVARAKTYGSAYLLPEFELEEDIIHSVVVDVADDDIEGEEL